MAKGASAPKADPAIGQAALTQAQLGSDYLTFAREQFAAENVRADEMSALARDVATDQIAASKTAQEWAAEDRARSKSVFQPMQDDLIKTAANWDSKERQDSVAAEARADVLNDAAVQAGSRSRSMAAMGVSPGSGRYAGVERAADTATALAAAGAENKARATVRKEAIALKGDAVNMGAGLASSAGASLGLGVQAGSASVGTTAAGNSGYAQARGVMRDGTGVAMSGYSSQANILNSLYGNQLAGWQAKQQASAGMLGGVGSIVGAAAMFSSKDFKKDKRPAKGVLDAVKKMPVEEWSYKPGIADGGAHIGPYAEDFKKATGKGDGRVIPIVDAIGLSLGAIQELSDKVDAVAKGVVTTRKAA